MLNLSTVYLAFHHCVKIAGRNNLAYLSYGLGDSGPHRGGLEEKPGSYHSWQGSTVQDRKDSGII